MKSPPTKKCLAVQSSPAPLKFALSQGWPKGLEPLAGAVNIAILPNVFPKWCFKSLHLEAFSAGWVKWQRFKAHFHGCVGLDATNEALAAIYIQLDNRHWQMMLGH